MRRVSTDEPRGRTAAVSDSETDSNEGQQSAVRQTSRKNEVQLSGSVKRVQQHLTVTDRLRRQQPTMLYGEGNALPPLLVTRWYKTYGSPISFVICVLLPVIVAAIYYGTVASPQYVTEFRFSVTDTSAGSSTASSGLAALVGGSTTGGTDNYLVTDYLISRQAIDDMQARIHVTDIYSKPSIDWWSRYDASQPIEQFVRYWPKMVTAHFDQITGIAIAEVRAFSPQDAYLVANTLVKLSEELVNRISSRTNDDAVIFAEREVEKAQDRLKRARLEMMEGPGRKGGAGDGASDRASSLLLDMERQIAQTMLANAMQTLVQARANAAAQHVYITPYVRPSVPQSSIYPRPFLATALVGLLAFALWLIGLLVIRSIFERFN